MFSLFLYVFQVRFVVSLIRERFNDVIVIGRDLLRVLQYVAKIPEFEQLWHDLLHSPKSLSPTFTGITQLMHTRTSRRFLQSRITPEMEKKLVFLTSQVRGLKFVKFSKFSISQKSLAKVYLIGRKNDSRIVEVQTDFRECYTGMV